MQFNNRFKQIIFIGNYVLKNVLIKTQGWSDYPHVPPTNHHYVYMLVINSVWDIFQI